MRGTNFIEHLLVGPYRSPGASHISSCGGYDCHDASWPLGVCTNKSGKLPIVTIGRFWLLDCTVILLSSVTGTASATGWLLLESDDS